jgi:hypothetical protein
VLITFKAALLNILNTKHAIHFLLHKYIQGVTKMVRQTSRVSSSHQNKDKSSYKHILDRFSKNRLISNLTKLCPVEPSFSVQTGGQMDRRSDMTKLIFAFRNFAKAPINYTVFIPIYFGSRSLSSGSNLINFHTYKLYMN